ncbi:MULTISPECIES: ABC transporter ATP-binding protein [Cereibacter]|uniref:ABC transporter ATP-binding protein n=1 Tax=Cereibacter TaxID=1653176 RepID=UPI0002A3B0C0|nr:MULTISPECIES: oligopeptide/dipeptide ABC transporter ATP-binding protein [Cereibacter]EKX56190.1 Oligopeptide transport ATP-binding protein OppF [Rhodobacter sp. AKP1]MEA5162757.1 oligopeptide/dipeptide ABC transporter ATP-binding protein [Cereibacter johrii]
MTSVPMIAAHELSKVFPLERGLWSALSRKLSGRPPRRVQAVDRVSFEVAPGETVGIVGESGCGKSTLAKMLAGLSGANGGELLLRGRPLAEAMADPRQALKVQMIFQDPQSSLNARMKVVDIVGEAPVVHGLIPRSGKEARVRAMLERVGLGPEALHRYPHQFSGGQRQRIGIARALAVEPELLICDESVAALDVSVQAQIINLLMELRRDLGLTMLFISHDLSVIRHICDRVIVMYLGRAVEIAPTDALFADPRHPYTRMLLAGMPRISTERRAFLEVAGEIPSPLAPPAGCHFHPRCQFRTEACLAQRPPLDPVDARRSAACLRWREIG